MYEYDVRVLLLLLLGSTAHHGLTAEHTGLLQLGELSNAALVPTLAGTYACRVEVVGSQDYGMYGNPSQFISRITPVVSTRSHGSARTCLLSRGRSRSTG
jgi:hypothetical protein